MRNKNQRVKQRQFEIIEAEHYGMCFGVKAAIAKAQQMAESAPVTVLGELAHNKTVQQGMSQRGALLGDLGDQAATTRDVIITAHGAADRDRKRWADRGHQVLDTTCPLVHKAHAALRDLVEAGYTPVVIGKAGHVEVRGLTGDFPQTVVVLTLDDVAAMDLDSNKIGIISQTTQQLTHVVSIVKAIENKFPAAQVCFTDTVCRPTKDRQVALLKLCVQVDLVIVVGGSNSNNTAQLAEKCRQLGCIAYHVQSAGDVCQAWFNGFAKVGLTAGTSTPDADILRVKKRLLEISSNESYLSPAMSEL